MNPSRHYGNQDQSADQTEMPEQAKNGKNWHKDILLLTYVLDSIRIK
jgi:hypothetical protein